MPAISGGEFRTNISLDENGGALAVGGNLLMNGTIVTGSQSLDSGGAIFVTGTTTIENALIADNFRMAAPAVVCVPSAPLISTIANLSRIRPKTRVAACV